MVVETNRLPELLSDPDQFDFLFTLPRLRPELSHGSEAGNTYAYVESSPADSSDEDGLQKRNSGNPRLISQFPSTWLGQQGAWFRGQFYPRLNQSQTANSWRPPNQCAIPSIGNNPRYSQGRTNTDAPGGSTAAGALFLQYARPGGFKWSPLVTNAGTNIGIRISAPSVNGGNVNMRIMNSGSVNVDIQPGGLFTSTTVHFPP